jgi:Spy/CpxP family protein refolding chaperone
MNLYTPILITAGFVISSFTMAAPPADDLLAGPSIEAEEVTSQDMTDRVLKEQSKSKKVGSRQQSQIWRTALKVIDLTKDQEMEIDKIMEEFQKLNQIFRSTHGKEIRSIRDEYGNKKRDVLTTILTGAPKDKALIPEASQKRMLELMELAPDAKVYQEKAWVLLTAQQQKKFQSKYQELLDEEAKRKEANKNKDMPMDESKKRETVIPQKRMLDDAAVRRINFLRKLQGLQDD